MTNEEGLTDNYIRDLLEALGIPWLFFLKHKVYVLETIFGLYEYTRVRDPVRAREYLNILKILFPSFSIPKELRKICGLKISSPKPQPNETKTVFNYGYNARYYFDYCSSKYNALIQKAKFSIKIFCANSAGKKIKDLSIYEKKYEFLEYWKFPKVGDDFVGREYDVHLSNASKAFEAYEAGAKRNRIFVKCPGYIVEATQDFYLTKGTVTNESVKPFNSGVTFGYLSKGVSGRITFYKDNVYPVEYALSANDLFLGKKYFDRTAVAEMARNTEVYRVSHRTVNFVSGNVKKRLEPTELKDYKRDI